MCCMPLTPTMGEKLSVLHIPHTHHGERSLVYAQSTHLTMGEEPGPAPRCWERGSQGRLIPHKLINVEN